jgi:hypothetical protein
MNYKSNEIFNNYFKIDFNWNIKFHHWFIFRMSSLKEVGKIFEKELKNTMKKAPKKTKFY